MPKNVFPLLNELFFKKSLERSLENPKKLNQIKGIEALAQKKIADKNPNPFDITRQKKTEALKEIFVDPYELAKAKDNLFGEVLEGYLDIPQSHWSINDIINAREGGPQEEKLGLRPFRESAYKDSKNAYKRSVKRINNMTLNDADRYTYGTDRIKAEHPHALPDLDYDEFFNDYVDLPSTWRGVIDKKLEEKIRFMREVQNKKDRFKLIKSAFQKNSSKKPENFDLSDIIDE